MYWDFIIYTAIVNSIFGTMIRNNQYQYLNYRPLRPKFDNISFFIAIIVFLFLGFLPFVTAENDTIVVAVPDETLRIYAYTILLMFILYHFYKSRDMARARQEDARQADVQRINARNDNLILALANTFLNVIGGIILHLVRRRPPN